MHQPQPWLHAHVVNPIYPRECGERLDAFAERERRVPASSGDPGKNRMLRGKIDKFSLDTLFDLTGRVGLKVSIALRKAT